MPGQAAHGEQPGPPLPLGALLASIRGELVDLRGCVDDLQAAIGEILAGSTAPLSPSAQIRLQAADRLSQRLAALVELTGALEPQVPGAWTLDPQSCGNLPVVLKRLEATARGRAPSDAGECEIF